LAKVAAVPVGGGVVSADGVLVMQLKAGEFTAFDATCPHQQFTVQPPDSQGVITCRGHTHRGRRRLGDRRSAFRGLTWSRSGLRRRGRARLDFIPASSGSPRRGGSPR
jgi:hypothetical protein